MRLLAVVIVSAACIVVLLTGALAFQIFRGGFSACADRPPSRQPWRVACDCSRCLGRAHAPRCRFRTWSSPSRSRFIIIHNGVRYTAMPGWGSGDPQGDTDSWELVHAIRRIPQLSTEVEGMESLVPGWSHREHEHSHGHLH